MHSEDHKRRFDLDGHVLIRNVADPQMLEKHRGPIREASQRLNSQSLRLEDRDTYGKAFLQTMNLWREDEAVKDFVFEKKFADIAAGLLGVERVRLYHDQALFKEPGGGPTPWHQDQYYWPLDTDRTITMWMPLVNIDTEMGMLTFASGSHRGGVVDDLAISDESDTVLARYVEEKGFSVTRAEAMEAGDATFHLGLTIHTAGANPSTRLREVMTIIYYADGARVTEPRNKHQQADLDTWLTPRDHGELADGPLNPVLN